MAGTITNPTGDIAVEQQLFQQNFPQGAPGNTAVIGGQEFVPPGFGTTTPTTLGQQLAGSNSMVQNGFNQQQVAPTNLSTSGFGPPQPFSQPAISPEQSALQQGKLGIQNFMHQNQNSLNNNRMQMPISQQQVNPLVGSQGAPNGVFSQNQFTQSPVTTNATYNQGNVYGGYNAGGVQTMPTPDYNPNNVFQTNGLNNFGPQNYPSNWYTPNAPLPPPPIQNPQLNPPPINPNGFPPPPVNQNPQTNGGGVNSNGFPPTPVTQNPNQPTTTTFTFSDENLKTEIKSGKDEVQDFLSSINAWNYQYKDEQDGISRAGFFTSPMAQELEQTDLGKQAVIETPRGKMVDYARLGGVNLAASAVMYREQEAMKQRFAVLEQQVLKHLINKGKNG
jgi:Chaperone of endosialidase